MDNQIGGYTLVNEEKLDRALNGTLLADGSKIGGVVREDGTYDEVELITEYDKLGGLILRGNDKVKTGSFYDFKNKKARKEPEVMFIFNINGKFVEVPDGKELPGEVRAAKILSEEVAEEKVDKKSKKGKK